MIISKKSQKLLDDFDTASQNWGWTEDQGVGKQVDVSYQIYKEAYNDLVQHMSDLEKKIKSNKEKQ